MKKLLPLLIFLLAIRFSINAQYVTIPDANFVTWLNAHGYSTCMSGNQMDTSCAMVDTSTLLIVHRRIFLI